jgi:hypothetical protein
MDPAKLELLSGQLQGFRKRFRQSLLEVHHRIAVADDLAEMSPTERNDIDNLITLCHRDHLEQTAKLQRQKRNARRNP